MRFFRSHPPTTQVPDPEPVTVPLTLEDAPFDDLWRELRRRDWVPLPDGVWESTIGDLQAQITEAESRVTAGDARAADAEAKKVEALELMGKVLADSRHVRERADQAESEISRFAAAFVAAEFPDLTTDDEAPTND